MRLFRWIIFGVIGLVAILIAVANRQMATFHPEPFGLGIDSVRAYSVPLFVIIFASVALGLVLGLFIEWLREGSHRRKAGKVRREAGALRHEVNRLSKQLKVDDEPAVAKAPILRS